MINVSSQEQEDLKRLNNSLACVFMLDREIEGQKFEEVYQEALKLIGQETDEEIWKAVVEWVYYCLKRRYSEEKAEELFEEVDFRKHSRKEVTNMLETMPEKLIDYASQKAKKEIALRNGIQITSPFGTAL